MIHGDWRDVVNPRRLIFGPSSVDISRGKEKTEETVFCPFSTPLTDSMSSPLVAACSLVKYSRRVLCSDSGMVCRAIHSFTTRISW